MTFPITIESDQGQFTATLLGAPEVRVAGATRDQAVEKLRAVLAERVQHGELIVIDIPPPGVAALAGKYADDPTLREICDDAYRSRDAEPLE